MREGKGSPLTIAFAALAVLAAGLSAAELDRLRVGVAALFAALAAMAERPRLRFPWLLWIFGAFSLLWSEDKSSTAWTLIWAGGALALWSAAGSGGGVRRAIGLLVGLRALEILYRAGGNLGSALQEPEGVSRTWQTGGLPGLLRALFQGDLAREPNWLTGGGYLNPNHAAMLVGLGAIECAGAWLSTGRPKKKLWLAGAAVLSALCLLRGSLTATTALGIGVLWLASRNARSARMRFWLQNAGVALGACVLFGLFTPPGHRFILWLKGGDRFALERFAIWKDTLRGWLARPVAGYGLGSFDAVYPQYKSLPGMRSSFHAHNEYLQALLETGLLGTGLGLAAAGWLFLKLRRENPAGAACLLAVGVQAVGESSFHAPTVLYPLAALCAFPARGEGKGGRAIAAAAVILLGSGATVFSELQFRRGVRWQKTDPAFARECFRAASRWAPWEARPAEARALLEKGSDPAALQRAREAAEEALALAPRRIPARIARARALARAGNAAAAQEEWARIVSLAPNVPAFRSSWALAMERMGRSAEAARQRRIAGALPEFTPQDRLGPAWLSP